MVARLLAQPISQALGKSIVVDNAVGAAGNIAAERVAKATPDGYTLGLMTEAQMLINPGLYKLEYDPARDFAPISQVAVAPYLLIVHDAVPAKSVRELIGLARSRPGASTFASPGNGSMPHMVAELFKTVANIDILHVPYKGVSLALPDLIAGRVTMMFSPIATGLPLLREGKVRALAVTSIKRSSAAPDFPTIAEAGYGDFDVTGWLALVSPAKTPAPIIRTLYLEISRALASAEVRAKLAILGLEPIGGSPEELSSAIRPGIAKWSRVTKDSGIRPD